MTESRIASDARQADLGRTGELRRGRGTGRGRRRGGGERRMVPDATFTSYYGRPVVKASPWEADIPAYLFLGGVAAGSAILGAGAHATHRAALRRTGRLAALAAIGASFVALVHDLGKPSRFVNMLRVAKPTSPMSVGTWILSGFAPMVGVAAAAELLPAEGRGPRGLRGPFRLLRRLSGPAGAVSALIAPAVASYTAVLLADTATPTWNAARDELPFVFAGSAAAASGGVAMMFTPVAEAGPARRLARGGALLDLAAEQRMEDRMGIVAETLRSGRAGQLMQASKALTVFGAAASLLARRSRVAAVVSGAALAAGSACTRFGIFEAGQASAHDPKYTVVPQRERITRGESAGA